MAEARVVKRYANRKLYDTQRSCYVTLHQIAEMIRSGEDVKIVDNNSKEDLTALTLTQIIFEQEKKGGFLPLSALRHIIQSGGQSISHIASQAGEKVRAVFRRERADDEGEEPPPEEVPASGAWRELFERSQETLDDWQKRVDERIRHTLEAISPLSSVEKELRTLSQRLAEIEKRLEEHEGAESATRDVIRR